MGTTNRPRNGAGEVRLTIGALSRAVGIPVETLRTWERRYGVPAAERTAAGHRRYGTHEIIRLRAVAALLERGIRAREALTVTDDGRQELLAAAGARSTLGGVPEATPVTSALVAAVRRFDGRELTRQLHAAWASLGPIGFAARCMPPLLEAVGEGWASGALSVRHEHFLTERVSDLLRSLRVPLETEATGPLVVLATLPGEEHGLGLLLAALVLVAGGCRTLNAGTQIPVDELASLAHDVRARVVGVSVSSASAGSAASRGVGRLRGVLAPTTRLIVGGAGAPRRRHGVEVLDSLDALATWSRTMAGRGG